MKNASRLLSLLLVAAAISACSVSPTGPEVADAAYTGAPNPPPPPPVDPGGNN